MTATPRHHDELAPPILPRGRRGMRLARAPLWLAKMIHGSRTIAELQALEDPLRAWCGHPLYESLVSQFSARVRAFATSQAERPRAPRRLNKAEMCRVTRQMIRTATHAELDAFMQRLRLRYVSDARRDEIERLARVRRERLTRVAPRDRWYAPKNVTNDGP